MSDKEVVANLINENIDLEEKVKPEELEEYKMNFTTFEYENEEADIVVYKYKAKEGVYFLIVCQSTENKDMAYRIAEYSYEIIKEHEKNTTIKELQALVIPIVLYTGKETWTAETNLKNIQAKMPGYKNNGLGNYLLVDANEIPEEKLVKDESVLSKVLLFEKAKDKTEMKDACEALKSCKLTLRQYRLLETYLYNVISEKVGQSVVQETLEELSKRMKT